MKLIASIAVLVLGALALAPVPAARAAMPQALPSLSQPSLSPDDGRIAFVADSAIWSVATSGGAAHLLIADGGNDSRPLYSPDGTRLALVSDATGNGDIYVLTLASGKLARITYADSHEQLTGWSRDGRWLVFSSSRNNVSGMQGVFRVSSSGGTPMPVSLEPYRNEAQAVPSPDGKTIALVGGMGDWQWWRHGHAHIDDSEIWLLRNDGSRRYRVLAAPHARADWPMWAPGGQSLFYMSDSNGTENLYRLKLDGTQTQLTHFSDGRLMWPQIAADGKTIAFERGFGIWLTDTATGMSHAVPITLSGAVRGPGVEHKDFHKHFTELRISPDGKKLAFIVHGEVFASTTDADKAGDADRVTHTPGAEYDLAWAPDSRHLVYGSVRDGSRNLYEYDFRSDREKQLTHGNGEDTQAVFSPDGKQLAFLRNADELCVLDLATGKIRVLVQHRIDLRRPLNSSRVLAWSPAGDWIAYPAWGKRMYYNANAVRVADGRVVQVSQLANANAGDVSWSSDGKALYFVTSQRTKRGRVARVDLVPRTPVFRENQFHDLFNEDTSAPNQAATENTDNSHSDQSKAKQKPKPVEIVAAGIRERLDLLPMGLDVQAIRIDPDGKHLVFTAQVAGKTNLYVWSLDRLAKKAPVARQLTSSHGYKTVAGFSNDGKNVYYLDGGKIRSIALKQGSKAKSLDVSAQMNVDFSREKMVVFNQAWRWLRDNFHDPKMHGVDWSAIHAKYAPRIEGAATPAAMRRLLNLMVGELNSSHSGVRSGDKPDYATGHLGLRFDPATHAKNGELRITSVLPLSPAAVSGKIHAGDVLLSVDGQNVGTHYSLARALNHRVGHQTKLRIRDAHGAAHTVEVKPIGTRAAADLAYDAWSNANRAYVARISHGKLGYVHLRDMSMDSLQRFYKDLDAQNSTREGVVIDERNNFGGFVNAYALDVLSRRPYLYMTFRGFNHAWPARSINGQRALERPTVLVTNRVTLSDGEDFAEGYRALGLGKVVGEPTAGWIVYTSNMPLIDGSVVRLPFITVTDAQGKPMELHPRPVDVKVSRAPGESYHGVDSQLDAAVATLLKQIDAP